MSEGRPVDVSCAHGPHRATHAGRERRRPAHTRADDPAVRGWASALADSYAEPTEPGLSDREHT